MESKDPRRAPRHTSPAPRPTAKPASTAKKTGGTTTAKPEPVTTALTLFALLWGQLQVAHMLKDLKGDWQALSPGQTAALLAMAPVAVFPSKASLLLPLAAFGSGVYLLFHGSRSNHILQDLLMNLAICLAASRKSAEFLRRLAEFSHRYLVVLYFISALHKMNRDFFDMRVSCASGTTATLLAQYLPSLVPASSNLSSLLLKISPFAAAIGEVVLPALLLSIGPPPVDRAEAGFSRRAAVALGVAFHMMLAMPLPPASFYPFSASCLALYVLQLPVPLASFASRAREAAPELSKLWWMLPPLFVASCIGFNMRGSLSAWLRIGEGVHAPFEYPPYDLYNAGVLWCFGVSVMLLGVATWHHRTPSLPVQELREINLRRSGFGSVVIVSCTLLLGLGPYLGLRTYPAFAMFSNLRVEGNSPNHLFLGGGLDLLGFQRDSVRVLATNSTTLLNFQVDLARLYTRSTTEFMAASGMEAALWICPPAWPHAPAANFTEFSIPAVELQRRLQLVDKAAKVKGEAKGAWFAKVVRGDRELDLSGSDDLPVDCGGLISQTLCQLVKEYIAGPFRTFDDTASPCRH